MNRDNRGEASLGIAREDDFLVSPVVHLFEDVHGLVVLSEPRNGVTPAAAWRLSAPPPAACRDQRPWSGFIRRRRTAPPDRCSTACSASSTATCNAACRRLTTTLGSPLRTTFTVHSWSTPPRGPLASRARTVTLSIDQANLPSLNPSLRLMSACSSPLRATPITRTCAGLGEARPPERLSGRDTDGGRTDRRPAPATSLI